jgi:hypothetical protein
VTIVDTRHELLRNRAAFRGIGSGILTAAAALTVACFSPPPAATGSAPATPDAGPERRSALLGDTLHIELGRSASVDGGRLVLTFAAHGADSRCPATAVCVWMGDVAVRIIAGVRNTSVERQLHTGIEPHSFTVGRYVVTVVGLLPYPGTEPPDALRTIPTVLLRVTR